MYEIVFFAGGLGTRLKNSEFLPKPLVDINGKTLLSRIINTFEATKLFHKYHILTCLNSDIYDDLLIKEHSNLDLNIYTEPQRSGRTGALKYFLEENAIIKNFFVANGDTLFSNLLSNAITSAVNSCKKDIPITFLGKPDPFRNDYLTVKKNGNENFQKMQNSGLFYISRTWLNEKVFVNKELEDLDYYIYKLNFEIMTYSLECNLYDAGTPERLMKIRTLIK